MRETVLVGTLIVVALIAQATPVEKGAKALFLDPTSGVAVTPLKTPSGQVRRAPVRKPVETSGEVNAGLMYYIERERPDGGLERVNPNVTFHSGDRIRMHFKSNVPGRLVIAQRNLDGGASVLFPDPRVSGGDNRIQAGQVTAIPSASAWFKFDNNPGEERLLVMLTPEGNRADPSTFPPGPWKQWDAKRTDELVSLARAQKGSKALLIEVDEDKDSAATYAVQPAGEVVSQGVITLEIVLNHR